MQRVPAVYLHLLQSN